MRHNANKYSKRAWAAILLVFTVQTTLANPVGPSVVNGQASFATAGNTLTVTNTPGAIINWQGFSIGANEITRFAQQNASSAVLNRVISSNPSSILGSLQSNGRVFLVNPNGIVFGQGATVDVAGLVATSLNLSNADFLAGRYNFTDMPGAQSISNAGSLAAQGDGLSGGQIYLIAPDVENTGIITAPNGEILLAAGHSVDLVNSIEPNLRVSITAPAGDATNIGQLIAESGSLGLFGTVVRNSGTASADSATTQGGKIVFKASQRAEISGTVSANSTATPPNLPLSGEASTSSLPDKGGLGRVGGTIQVLGNEVGVTGSLDASGLNGGGTVLVGGDYQGKNPEVQNATVTYFGTNASIKADATRNGDGGKVIVWADDTTRAYGSISARGGEQGGDGGFVETSGKQGLDVRARVDASAPNGAAGTWLLDPTNITVAASGVAALTDVDAFADNTNCTDCAIDPSSINSSSTTVILQATNNITFTDAVNMTFSGAGLTAQAGNDILVNAPIATTGGDIYLSAPGQLAMAPNSTLFGANITLKANSIAIDTSGTPASVTATNTAWLFPASVGWNVDLGSTTDIAGNTLELSGAELNRITAGVLRIGDVSAGGINISTNIAPTGTFTLSLHSGGLVSSQGGTITATNLAIDALGNVALNAANNVTNLAAQVSGSASNFSFQNAGALNIATGIDGLSGISMPGFVNPYGVIALTSGGDLTQSAGALLAGSSVQAVAGGPGSSVLLNANNPTGVIAGSAGGSFSYNSINGIAVTTVGSSVGIQAGSNVTLYAGSAGINQNAPIDAGAGANISLSTPGSSAINSSMNAATINIQSPGGIMLGTASSLTANGVATIILNAGTGGFYNNSSLVASVLSTPRWLVYADNPGIVFKGGLTSDFRHYNGTFANYPPASVTEPGNGFIYASAPGVLSVNTTLVSGAASHIYGATPTAQFGYAIGNPTIADNEDLLLIAGTPVFTPVISSTTPAGQYGVSYLSGLSSAAGYTFTPGTGLLYIIDPATLALITASLTGTAGKTYDGTNTAPLAPGNFLLSGFVNGDSATVTKTTGAYDSPNVGSGILVSTTLAATDFSPVGSTNLANYTLPTGASGPIGNITPAPLTVAANPDSKVYDGMAYSGGNGVSYSGLMNGETAAVLGGTLAYGGTSQGAVNAGSYLITPSGLTSSNYTIGYVDGALTITPAALGLMSVSANDASKTYGDTLTFTGTEFTPAGLLGGDTISGVTLTSPGAVDTANAGIYAITPSNAVFSVGNAGNYTISYVDGQLTVNPAPLTVTADALSKAAGNPDPLLTYTTAGLKLADTAANTLSGELARLAGETAGVYPVNQGTLSLLSSNYTMNYVPADFSIVAPSTVVNELVNNIVLAPPGVPFEPPASPEPAQTPAADADDEESDEAAAVMQDGTPANETATAAAPLPVCK